MIFAIIWSDLRVVSCVITVCHVALDLHTAKQENNLAL